jgi:hypothetical protein
VRQIGAQTILGIKHRGKKSLGITTKGNYPRKNCAAGLEFRLKTAG